MQSKIDILEMVQQYENIYTSEVEHTSPIKKFLEDFDGEQLFDRKNFTGHVTASAYVINPQKDSLLLLRHKAFDRWLQPGGHVDRSDETLLNAALRETKEETGINFDNLFLVTDSIFKVDSHSIPANELKKEPPHIHHDISFLFLCDILEINIDKKESTAGRWVPFSDIVNDIDYADLIKKIKRMIKTFN